MTRLRCAVAQMSGVQPDQPREAVVARMIHLLEQAAARGATFVAFPELALTTFFPRTWYADIAEVDRHFEDAMPGPATAPLFEAARRLGVAPAPRTLWPDRRSELGARQLQDPLRSDMKRVMPCL